MDDRLIGARLRHLRWRTGCSQMALGDALGVSPQQVQKYETGANRVSAMTLKKAAEFFEVDISHFFQEGPEGEARLSKLSIELASMIDHLSYTQQITIRNLLREFS